MHGAWVRSLVGELRCPHAMWRGQKTKSLPCCVTRWSISLSVRWDAAWFMNRLIKPIYSKFKVNLQIYSVKSCFLIHWWHSEVATNSWICIPPEMFCIKICMCTFLRSTLMIPLANRMILWLNAYLFKKKKINILVAVMGSEANFW